MTSVGWLLVDVVSQLLAFRLAFSTHDSLARRSTLVLVR